MLNAFDRCKIYGFKEITMSSTMTQETYAGESFREGCSLHNISGRLY